MSRHHTLAALGLLAVLGASVTGCASARTQSFTERSANFQQYTSFAWASKDELATGDPRLDNNEFFRNRIQADVERALTERGYVRDSSGSPGLVVHYHASVSQKIDVNAEDRPYGYCQDCRSSVYSAGTITIDLVDASSKRLIWRGWSEGSLDGLDSQTWLEQRVDGAVHDLMRTVPARR